MAIRLSGINSGLDTDAIVQELVSAYSLKTQKYEKAQTKLSWKQDIWKSLNTKIYGLYTNVSNLRLSSAYSLKKTTVSDSTKASVTASSTAAVGTQKLEVKQLAQACYMTGAEVSLLDGEKVTGDTKLSELGYTGGEAKIEIVRGDGTKAEIDILKSTTVSEFVKELQNNGLNANFDEANQRIFVSAKKAGTDNNFVLMGDGKDGADALKLLGLDTALVSEDGTFTELGAQYYQADYDLFEAAKKAGKNGISGIQEYIQEQIAQYDLWEAQINAGKARDSIYDALESLGLHPTVSDLQSKVDIYGTSSEEEQKTALKEYLKKMGVEEDDLAKQVGTNADGTTITVLDELFEKATISSHYANTASQINTIFEDVYIFDRPSVSALQDVIGADGLTTDEDKKKALQEYIEKQTGQKAVNVDNLYTSLTKLEDAGIDETNISATRKEISNTLNTLLPLDGLQNAIADVATDEDKKTKLGEYLKGLKKADGSPISDADIEKYSASILENLEKIALYEDPSSVSTLYSGISDQLNQLFTDKGETSTRPTIEKLQSELAGVSSDKQLAALTDYLNKHYFSENLDLENAETKTKLENLLSDLNKVKDFVPSEERDAYQTIDNALASADLKITGTDSSITSIDSLQEAYQEACTAGTIDETDDETAKEWLKDLIQNNTLTDGDKEVLADRLYESLQTISAYEAKTTESGTRPSVETLNTTEITESMNNSMVKDLAESEDISDLDTAIYNKAMDAFEANRILNSEEYKSDGASRVPGSDAIISLNGVEFTGSSNSFNINGLAIEVTGETTDPVIITTNTDTQGIYDKVKDFLTEYNNVINEMTKLYNADSARDYEPLTDEEKEAMSEEQIEKWENKIKDSLLRRDTTLNSVMSSMINAMSSSYEIDGKKVSLSTFGIKTLGFLNAPDNENYAFHIDGDEDDENTSANEDKLMVAIQENPDQIMEFMKQLTAGLYTAIDNKMKSTDLSSAYKVYNDKEMDKQYKEYSSIISDWEDKVSEREEYYYNKFSQMEVALSKLNSQTSSISGLLGM